MCWGHYSTTAFHFDVKLQVDQELSIRLDAGENTVLGVQFTGENASVEISAKLELDLSFGIDADSGEFFIAFRTFRTQRLG